MPNFKGVNISILTDPKGKNSSDKDDLMPLEEHVVWPQNEKNYKKSQVTCFVEATTDQRFHILVNPSGDHELSEANLGPDGLKKLFDQKIISIDPTWEWQKEWAIDQVRALEILYSVKVYLDGNKRMAVYHSIYDSSSAPLVISYGSTYYEHPKLPRKRVEWYFKPLSAHERTDVALMETLSSLAIAKKIEGEEELAEEFEGMLLRNQKRLGGGETGRIVVTLQRIVLDKSKAKKKAANESTPDSESDSEWESDEDSESDGALTGDLSESVIGGSCGRAEKIAPTHIVERRIGDKESQEYVDIKVIDDNSEPYATFVFHYRDKATLQKQVLDKLSKYNENSNIKAGTKKRSHEQDDRENKNATTKTARNSPDNKRRQLGAYVTEAPKLSAGPLLNLAYRPTRSLAGMRPSRVPETALPNPFANLLKADTKSMPQNSSKSKSKGDNFMFDCSGCGVKGANLDDGTPMMACETCEKWVHIACHGISEERARADDYHFVCDACSGEIS